MEYYSGNYRDCIVEYKTDKERQKNLNVHKHMRQFLYDASIYYLTLGFVVFRFTTLPQGDGDLLMPITIPIHDIDWEYSEPDYSLYTQMPEVTIRSRVVHDDSMRFYVYKFNCSFAQNTSQNAHGILFRLVHIFRRLVHAQDYDLIIRNENLRKTVFIEQTIPVEKETTNWKLGADRSELQTIMDNVRQQRLTTHHPQPLSASEDIKAAIMVRILYSLYCLPLWCDI